MSVAAAARAAIALPPSVTPSIMAGRPCVLMGMTPTAWLSAPVAMSAVAILQWTKRPPVQFLGDQSRLRRRPHTGGGRRKSSEAVS